MEHIYPIFDQVVSRDEKQSFLGQKGGVFWLTGLSGSGKSTLALSLERILMTKDYFPSLLDGDNMRNGLCKDLSFASADREENVRRIAEMAKVLVRNGIITICSFVSPMENMRKLAKTTIGEADFHLIYVKASVETCIERDTKGLYKKALKGEIKNFTGISAPYEVPEQPDLILDTEKYKAEENIENLLNYVLKCVKI